MSDHVQPRHGRPVHRPVDGELLGSVEPDGDAWIARTVFGGILARVGSEAEARDVVERDGLASLGRRWFYRADPAADWEVVLISEAWAGRARLVVGPYALPGVETIELRAEDLEAGADLTLVPPTADLAQFA